MGLNMRLNILALVTKRRREINGLKRLTERAGRRAVT